MHHFEAEVERWSTLIGRFILAFGEIELLSFALWRKYYPNSPPPHNFKERTGSVLAKLRTEVVPNRELVALFEESLRLADKRNTVAHHPMCVQVFEHTQTGEHMLELAIRSETQDEYITDEQLKLLGESTRELARRMYQTLWPSN
jgi:hypothetical protein